LEDQLNDLSQAEKREKTFEKKYLSISNAVVFYFSKWNKKISVYGSVHKLKMGTLNPSVGTPLDQLKAMD
jgi:hypothetical protein